MSNSFVLLLCSLLAAQMASSQMIPLKSEDGLEINYKWEVGKDSEQLLLVEVNNNNDVALDFELTLYFKKGTAVVESTGLLSLCVGAGKSLKPRISGLVFDVKTPRVEIEKIELGELNILLTERKSCHL